jgi:hypothetical protein
VTQQGVVPHFYRDRSPAGSGFDGRHLHEEVYRGKAQNARVEIPQISKGILRPTSSKG